MSVVSSIVEETIRPIFLSKKVEVTSMSSLMVVSAKVKRVGTASAWLLVFTKAAVTATGL